MAFKLNIPEPTHPCRCKHDVSVHRFAVIIGPEAAASECGMSGCECKKFFSG